MANIVLKLGNVFFFLLRNNIDTRGRGVAILYLSSAVPGILLVVIVLFISLALIGLALMGRLYIRHVSKEKISGFSLSEVFLLFFSELVLLGTP